MRSIVNTKSLPVLPELVQQLETNRGLDVHEQIKNSLIGHDPQSALLVHGLPRTSSGDVCRASISISASDFGPSVEL